MWKIICTHPHSFTIIQLPIAQIMMAAALVKGVNRCARSTHSTKRSIVSKLEVGQHTTFIHTVNHQTKFYHIFNRILTNLFYTTNSLYITIIIVHKSAFVPIFKVPCFKLIISYKKYHFPLCCALYQVYTCLDGTVLINVYDNNGLHTKEKEKKKIWR